MLYLLSWRVIFAATRDLQAPTGAGRRLAGTWASSPLRLGSWWWLLLTLVRSAYRGHPSLPNARCGRAPPPPRAVCLAPLCPFHSQSLVFFSPPPHPSGLDLIFIFQTSLKKFPRNPSEQQSDISIFLCSQWPLCLGVQQGRIRNADLFGVAGEAGLRVPSMWRIVSSVCYVLGKEWWLLWSLIV